MRCTAPPSVEYLAIQFRMGQWIDEASLTEFLPDALQLIQILLVLLLVLDFLTNAFENTDGGSVVIDTTSRAECSLDDGRRGDEIVGEAVVESSLDLEKVFSVLEELDVTFVEGFEGLLTVCARGWASEDGCYALNGGAGTKESGEHLSAHHGGGRW